MKKTGRQTRPEFHSGSGDNLPARERVLFSLWSKLLRNATLSE